MHGRVLEFAWTCTSVHLQINMWYSLDTLYYYGLGVACICRSEVILILRIVPHTSGVKFGIATPQREVHQYTIRVNCSTLKAECGPATHIGKERQETMAKGPIFIIRHAEFPEDRDKVARLFRAYAESLNVDLSFQKFEEEVASLPGNYSPLTGGALLLAALKPSQDGIPGSGHSRDENIIGCACLRALNPPGTCELKRLYITEESRGLGVGRNCCRAHSRKQEGSDTGKLSWTRSHRWWRRGRCIEMWVSRISKVIMRHRLRERFS